MAQNLENYFKSIFLVCDIVRKYAWEIFCRNSNSLNVGKNPGKCTFTNVIVQRLANIFVISPGKFCFRGLVLLGSWRKVQKTRMISFWSTNFGYISPRWRYKRWRWSHLGSLPMVQKIRNMSFWWTNFGYITLWLGVLLTCNMNEAHMVHFPYNGGTYMTKIELIVH